MVEKHPSTCTHDELKTSLVNVIEALGGLTKCVKKGQTVVIEPNVVEDPSLRDGGYNGGVVPDVGLVKALIEILLPVACKVIIGDKVIRTRFLWGGI